MLWGVRESQNGWGCKGLLEVTWSNPVPQAWSPRGLLYKTTFWQFLNISKKGDFMKSVGNLCPTMSGPQWKSDSWHWQGASCVPVCVQCFVPHHWENSKRSLASCPLYTVDARYLYILRFSEVLFSRVPDLTAFPHMKDAPVPQLSKWPTSCPHQILYEDFMGDSIKNVNEVQVDNNHWSFLIYQANCFIVECYLIHQAWLPLPEGMLTTSYHFLICVPANDFWYSLLHHFPRNEVKVIGLKFYEVSSCSPWRHLLSSND